MPQTPRPRPPKVSTTEDKTETLSGLTSGFSLLPVGAILEHGERSYEVVEGRVEQQDTSHIYMVEQVGTLLRICPQCGHGLEAGDDAFCADCGMDLSNVEPAAPRYLVREVADEILVARERTLTAEKLSHEGLLLPLAYFSQQLWEKQPRHYLVYPEEPTRDLEPASGLPRPQPLEAVLRWGIALAQGLSSLHGKRIVHGQVDLTHILVYDHDARLSGLEGAQPLASFPPERAPQLLGKDIVGLAKCLQDLLGGPKAELPPQVDDVLQRGRGNVPGQFYPTAQAFGEALQQALDNLAPQDIKVRTGHRTDVGVVRDHNEDNELVSEKGLLSGQLPFTFGIYVVADGMGGHAAGEIASDLATESAAETMRSGARTLEQAGSKQLEEIVKAGCLAANQAVFEERQRRGSDMGTTIVAALRIGDRVAIGNIGDSRAYLLNAQGIQQITVDHSLVQRLMDTGQITAAEAKVHPQRNLIYKVVGDKPNLEPDTFSLRLQPGDRLLLCSDGLSGMVDDDVMWQTVMGQQDPQMACDRLITLANEAGGEDNITAIIVQAE